MSRSVMVALLAGTVALSLSAPAAAATPGRVTLQAGTLRFQAGPGSVNDVRLSVSGGSVLVTDAVTPLTAGSPCVLISPNTAMCPAAGVSQLQVVLGDLDDKVGGHPRIGSRNENIYGDRGNDILVGGPVNSEIWGGPGNDEIYGNGGDDTLVGEGGDDKLDGGVHVNGDFGNGGLAETDTCVNLETKVDCEQ